MEDGATYVCVCEKKNNQNLKDRWIFAPQIL